MSVGVTAVIPTYNRAHLLGEAIDSVISQDYEPLELLVVDDGSTDDTPAVIEDYRRRSSCQITVVRQENGGESAARNAGIIAATHDVVAFLDSDNRWLPGKLREQLRFLEKGGCDFSFTAYVEFGSSLPDSREVRAVDWVEDSVSTLRALLIGCVVNTSTVVASRDVLIASGLFDTDLRCCADHDLWLKVAAAGHAFGYLDMPLTEYRVHEGSVSQEAALVARNSERVVERLFEHGSHLPAVIQRERKTHLSRWYLNSACRYIEAREPTDARRALWQAIKQKPRSIRFGWILLLLKSLYLGLLPSRRAGRSAS